MTTEYWRNRMMKVAFFIGTSDFYLGLSSSEPRDDGANVTEPAGNGYARVCIKEFSKPEAGEVHNPEAVDFPISTGRWFTSDAPASFWCLFDGPDADAKLITAGAISFPFPVRQDMLVRVPAGAVSIRLEDDTVELEDVLQDEGEVLILNAGAGTSNPVQMVYMQ